MKVDAALTKHGVVVLNSTTMIVNANERLIRLSDRLGRVILKCNKLDNIKTGLLPWIIEYQNIKNDMCAANDAFQNENNEILKLMMTYKLGFNPSMNSTVYLYNIQYSRCYSKTEVLDDILRGLVEVLVDNSELEELQRTEIEKAVKGVIEKTKTPNGMYA